jgi:hypothetical protein
MVLIAIPACLLPFIAGCPERFSCQLNPDAVEVSIECRPMSRQPLFKDYSFIIMTLQEIEERMDELSRRLVETHDKKIIKELYDLVLELEKVEKLETSVR